MRQYIKLKFLRDSIVSNENLGEKEKLKNILRIGSGTSEKMTLETIVTLMDELPRFKI